MDGNDSADDGQFDAIVAIGLVMVLQATLAVVSMVNDWTIWGFPGWLWLIVIVPEFGLLAALRLHIRKHGTEQMGRRRFISLLLVSLIAIVNLAALVVLIGSLLSGQELGGGQLLFKALTIWGTNVVAFGLLFWDRDAGGPVARRRDSDEHDRDFSFPQMQNPELAPDGWHPRLFDYIYVSFTNSIAFSPTDVMPLTHRAKLGMMVESGISATTVLLAAARAVNILR